MTTDLAIDPTPPILDHRFEPHPYLASICGHVHDDALACAHPRVAHRMVSGVSLNFNPNRYLPIPDIGPLTRIAP